MNFHLHNIVQYHLNPQEYLILSAWTGLLTMSENTVFGKTERFQGRGTDIPSQRVVEG